MIQIVDEITLAPRHIPDVLALLRDRYLPGHAARGLTAAGRWVSPPVAVPGQPSTLWLTTGGRRAGLLPDACVDGCRRGRILDGGRCAVRPAPPP